jgi:NAD+ kinase
MKNFGIFLNPHFAQNTAVTDILTKLQAGKQIHFFGMQEQRQLLPPFVNTEADIEHENPKLDCILVFGGDGTMLRAVKMAIATNAPLLGINIGSLGFLSESTLADLNASINSLLHNHYNIQTRMLLQVTLKRQGKIIFSALSLNDAVIYKAITPRLIEIRIYSNRRLVIDARCDGVVASTPTGSTAYSLSAGGPLLSPVMDAIVISPLNPHILATRPMVFPSSDLLSFKLTELYDKAILQIDGQNMHDLQNGDEILVTAAKQKISFIKLSNRTFYQILRKKMHMGKL